MNNYGKAVALLLMCIAIIPGYCMADQVNVPNLIAKGDVLSIDGTMTDSDNIQIWVLGINYWNGALTGETVRIPTDGTGTFLYQLELTSDMASGAYSVIAQSPGPNGEMDILTKAVNGATAVYSSNYPDAILFYIWNSQGMLRGSDAAEALTSIINSPDIDDTCIRLTFMVEEPWIVISSIGDRYAGETFTITGTTNLAVGDHLTIDVVPSSFQSQSGTFTGASGTVLVTKGNSGNAWEYTVDASSFNPDMYNVKVEAIEAETTATQTINVLKAVPTAEPIVTQTKTPTPAQTQTPTVTQTKTPTPTQTQTPTVTQSPTPTPTQTQTPTVTQSPTPTITYIVPTETGTPPSTTSVPSGISDDDRYEELNAEIAVLQAQIDEKNSEIEQKNSVIDALINLFKAIFGIDN